VSWTQPFCERCWFAENPGRLPVRFALPTEPAKQCCECGEPTVAGIYIRRDPAKVPFPSSED
jgi:hypothetical protein